MTATLWQTGLCLLSVAIGTVLFGALQRDLDGYPHDLPRWVRQSIAATGASVLPLVASRAALAL